MSKSNLGIVTGVNGSVGMQYAKSIGRRADSHVIGIGRRAIDVSDCEGNLEVVHPVDLLDRDRVKAAIEGIRGDHFKRIALVHPVGIFKWEEEPPAGDDIDQEVFHSNVTTFQHVLDAVLDMVKGRMSQAALSLVVFGSVSDKWAVPFWRSYTKSNDLLRKILVNTVTTHKDLSINAVNLDIGTIDVASERHLRPQANREYWLSIDELVQRSMPLIFPGEQDDQDRKSSLQRVEIFKPKPNFDPSNYYTDHDTIRKTWHMEMGIDNTVV